MMKYRRKPLIVLLLAAMTVMFVLFLNQFAPWPLDFTASNVKEKSFTKVACQEKNTSDNCHNPSNFITALQDYSFNWTKNEENHRKLRSLLATKCNGFQKAVVTQCNAPLGTKIAYDGDKYNLTVTQELFNMFPKDAPFSDKVLDTCAVVGNGGILSNSSCGEAIDSAQCVFRFNLPPIDTRYSKHVGKKTTAVTANPSIIHNKYGALRRRRRDFVDDISVYGDALMITSPFCFQYGTEVSILAYYTLEDFRSSVKIAFTHPDHLRDVNKFWRSQGVQLGLRLSSGLYIVSLALEICNNVDVFGFWPFYFHPFESHPLTNHYYDDLKPTRFHKMSSEFALLVQLHNQGVLKLHLGQCCP